MGDDYTGPVTVKAGDGSERELKDINVWGQSETILEMVKETDSGDIIPLASVPKEALDKVVIDLKHAHFWDITAVSALDKVVIKFRREGAEVEVIGMNEASATIVDRFGVHDKPEEVEKLLNGH